MALALYMDVHVPSPVTEGLRRRGVDVLTSQEDGTREATDEALLLRASELERLLFSQDGDLLRIAAEWRDADRGFYGVIYAHQRRAGVGQLVEDLELIASCCSAEELSGRVTYLPLSN